ncbi:MAG: LacI family DNA-binding transcriptional regulator [Acidimicrobiia bacterium]
MPENTGGNRPTIRDVAERAGVSKSLVSLVLRSSPKVSDKSRAAVEEAIEELGYRPSAMARSLVSRHSNVGGIITSNAQDVFYAGVVDGVSEYINENAIGLMPLILHGNHLVDDEERATKRFLELRAEWLMLMGSSLSDAAIETLGRETPTALIGRWLESDVVDVVVNDDGLGSTIATTHLIDLGHRHIAHITGGDGNGARTREASFRKVMEEAGREPIVVEGTYLRSGGAAAAQRLLDAPGPLPTAIFAANDLAAIGVIDVLRRTGRRVPEDVSVIGYDDIPMAGLEPIDLTTINQPARQMGQTAARLLCARRENTNLNGQRVVVAPALVVRSTTREI